MNIEEVKKLIRMANRMGLQGIKIIDWRPSTNASENSEGNWILQNGYEDE